MRWVSLTRLISGVSSTKAALPWTCLRKLSEYSTWGTEGVEGGGEALKRLNHFHHLAVSIHSRKGRSDDTQLLTERAAAAGIKEELAGMVGN